MRRLLVLLLVLLSRWAYAQAPVLRAHLEPASNIIVGQPVRLVVSVFVPNYFTSSPEFPEFEIENALVVPPQDRPENSNTQINGSSYAGITQTYVIYPQQAGDFRVPPVKLGVPYAIAPPTSTTAEVALPTLSFHAHVPTAALDLPYFLPTTQLTIMQRWSRPLKNLRTGDLVDRTITVTAKKMEAMLIPPLKLVQPNGIRVYPAEPVVRDQKTDRGDFVYGQRIETAKYVIQKPGDYTLPPIELKWWNLATRQLVTAAVPAVTFSAIDNPNYVAEIPPPPEAPAATHIEKAPPWQRYAPRLRHEVQLGLLVLLLFLIARLLHLTLARLATWRKKRSSSEAAQFRKLIHAAKANHPELTYSYLLKWFAVEFPGVPVDMVMHTLDEPVLRKVVEALSRTLYSNDLPVTKGWDGKALAVELRRFRAHLRDTHHSSSRRITLPTLNPSSITRSCLEIAQRDK